MPKSLLKLVEEDELNKVRMGRLTGAEEAEVQQLLRSSPLLHRIFSVGGIPDMMPPAPFSTRPRTPEGGHTFTFSHRTVSKASLREVPAGRIYLQPRVLLRAGAAARLREAGAQWDPRVSVEGRRGAWFVEAGQMPPDELRPAPVGLVRPALRGFKPSMPASKQRYIERSDGVACDTEGAPLSAGNMAKDCKGRENFWHAVAARERADGRVQSQIIAELPYEPAVGPEGWLRIVEALGGEFEALGLRWHGVVHRPDSHSDPRNFHLHLLYHDRGADWSPAAGEWVFQAKKAPETRRRSFIRDLRWRYAEVVNCELARAGLARRYNPRSYKDMGIAKRPGRHLGSAAHALERRGAVTEAGRWNWGSEHFWRLHNALKREQTALRRQIALAGEGVEMICAAGQSRSPRVMTAADLCAETLETVAEAGRVLGEARAVQDRTMWRAQDLPRRVKRLAAAAAGNDGHPALAREAEAWLSRLNRGLETSRGQSFQRRVDAGRKFRRAARTHLEAQRGLEAEILLDRRAVLISERDLVERALERGRAVASKLDEAVRRAAGAQTQLVSERDAVLMRAQGWAAAVDETPIRTRARLLTLAGRAAARRVGPGPEAARDLDALDRIDVRFAELNGEARRRERVRTELNRAGGVEDDLVRRALITQAHGARRAIDTLDTEIAAKPRAQALAERLGVELCGGDGMAGLAEAKARRDQSRQARRMQIRKARVYGAER